MNSCSGHIAVLQKYHTINSSDAHGRSCCPRSAPEVLCYASSRRQHLVPTVFVRVGDVLVSPVTAVRDLGVYIDGDVTIRTHVTSIVRACFSALPQIWSVRRSLTQHSTLTRVHALVITKLDYCNSVLAGTSVYLQNRQQSVLNAAFRLMFSHRASEHTTPLLRDLYWLRVSERIQFRLYTLAYHCVHGTAPAYLADSLRPTSDVAIFALPTRLRCWCRRLVV